MTTEEVLMSRELAMKFMVWAGYWNGLKLEKGKSFARFGMFSDEDCDRLDSIQEVLFKCFEAESVAAAMENLKQAKKNGDPCPFSRESLDLMFGRPE